MALVETQARHEPGIHAIHHAALGRSGTPVTYADAPPSLGSLTDRARNPRTMNATRQPNIVDDRSALRGPMEPLCL